MSDPAKLLLDRPAPHVARLLINRSDKRNAIDYDVRQLMIEALTTVLGDGESRAVVLGGVGGHFSAGGDIPSMVGLSQQQARARMRHIASLCRLVANARIAVVAAMEGTCAGACVGLALLGDYIVVGENTRILLPFLKLGLTPDWGSLWTLPQRIGLPATRRIATCGEPIAAPEAHRIGLADELVASDAVMHTAIIRASGLAKLPLGAYARMKQRLTQPSATLDEELQREEDDQAALLCSDEFAEGYAAFTGKRRADFINPRGAHR